MKNINHYFKTTLFIALLGALCFNVQAQRDGLQRNGTRGNQPQGKTRTAPATQNAKTKPAVPATNDKRNTNLKGSGPVPGTKSSQNPLQ